MKKIVIGLIVLVVVTLGGAFYYFSGKEYQFRFSANQIQEKLNTKLPLTKSYLLIFQVTLDNPRVALEDGSRRVKAGLDIILNIWAGKEPKPLGGSVDVSGGIRYSSQTGEFFLTDPIIEHLAIQGIPDLYTQKVNSVLTKALAEYYASHPIYSLTATDTQQAAAKLVLKDVIVEKGELVVTLGI